MSLDEADARADSDDNDGEARRWARPPDGDDVSVDDGGEVRVYGAPYNIELEPENAAGAPPPAEPPPIPKPRRRSRRSLIVVTALVVVALVAAGGVWWWTSQSSSSTTTPPATTKQLVAVTTGTVDSTVAAQGTVAAAQTANLNFSSAGTVTAVNVQAGDKVTNGQILATIDGTALAAATAKAQANLDAAEAKLSDDQAASASAEQLTADQSALTVAQDAFASAQFAQLGSAMISTIDGTVTAVNLTVGEQLSSGGSGGTTLSGSGSGSGRTSANIGTRSGGGQNSQNSSSATTPQIQVVTTGSFAVSLPVAASDITSVAVGQPVSLTVATASTPAFGGFGGFGGGGGFAGAFGGTRTGAGGGTGGTGGNGGNGTRGNGGGGNGGNGGTGGARQGAGNGGNGANGGNGGQGAANVGATATGKVSDVSKVADTSTGVGTYAVTVDFTADPSQFLIGATVNGSITTAQRNNVVLVPLLAVTTTPTGSTVTVATGASADGPTEVRNVTLGVRSGADVEVTSGLKDGDQVVVEIPAALANRLGGGTGTGGTGGTGGNGQAPTGASGSARRGGTGTSGTSGTSGGNGSTP